MYSNWNISAGLSSSLEVFQISIKEFEKKLSTTMLEATPRQKPQNLRKRLDEIKKKRGKDKLNINEVWGLLESNSK